MIHFAAASLLIVNLSFAAASHAFPAGLRRDQVDAPAASLAVRQVFVAVTGLMWLGLAIGLPLIVAGVAYSAIVVEVWEIVLFVVFWLVATRSEWTAKPSEAEAPGVTI